MVAATSGCGLRASLIRSLNSSSGGVVPVVVLGADSHIVVDAVYADEGGRRDVRAAHAEPDEDAGGVVPAEGLKCRLRVAFGERAGAVGVGIVVVAGGRGAGLGRGCGSISEVAPCMAASHARSLCAKKVGIAIAARMPMMITTTKSSIRVKPRSSLSTS